MTQNKQPRSSPLFLRLTPASEAQLTLLCGALTAIPPELAEALRKIPLE